MTPRQLTSLLALRLQGLSYQQIGDQFLISRQRVQQLLQPPPLMKLLVIARAHDACQRCGRPQEGHGHIHHKTVETARAKDYNSVDNLEYLCHRCHRHAHGPDMPRKPYQCQHCQYVWIPKRGRRPQRCANPQCRSLHWDELPTSQTLAPIRIDTRYQCSRCSHAWYPRSDEYPKQCPNRACRSASWSLPIGTASRRPGRRPGSTNRPRH